MADFTQEQNFLSALRELVKTFSDSKVSDKNSEFHSLSDLDVALKKDSQADQIAATTIDSKDKSDIEIQRKFEIFMREFNDSQFDYDLIPYDKITECVFDESAEERLDAFPSALKKLGQSYFHQEKDIQEIAEDIETKEKEFYKIMRHINLALIQKYNFASMKLNEMEKLSSNLKNLNDEYEKLKEDYLELKADADKQNKSMLTQFISILGIFAAILMGAFGAIQGFTSLFNNAWLPLGKLLIISSIGGSSVILILFFLLNGLAKLTGLSLSSSDKTNATMFEKHPTIFITHGILVLIALIGASLQLSNLKLHFAKEGFWWIVPPIWLAYFGYSLHKKSFWPFRLRQISSNN